MVPVVQNIFSYDSMKFKIRSGIIRIRINGTLDTGTPEYILLNLFADELTGEELNIIAEKSDSLYTYRINGQGLGYLGIKDPASRYFTINTKFKICASGKPDYLLVIPVNVHVSQRGEIDSNYCFVGNELQVYVSIDKNANKREEKKIGMNEKFKMAKF